MFRNYKNSRDAQLVLTGHLDEIDTESQKAYPDFEAIKALQHKVEHIETDVVVLTRRENVFKRTCVAIRLSPAEMKSLSTFSFSRAMNQIKSDGHLSGLENEINTEAVNEAKNLNTNWETHTNEDTENSYFS